MASRRAWTLLLVITLLLTLIAIPAQASSSQGEPDLAGRIDNKPDPLTTAQLALREKGLEAKLNGKAKGKVHEVAKGQYVELAREGEGAIWTVLGDFADLQHNEIPQPDRAVNNTTIWEPDFNRDYYLGILFNDANSMRSFYVEQSSNRYTVHGDVTEWIPVPNNAAYYDDNPDANVWKFLQDTVNGWYEMEIAAGKTPAQIDEYLSQFDVWDRYDYDGDGNFDEPDGYIDTFQSIHAGEGEEAGAPAWTIWSHSWYAYYNLIGTAGPDFNKYGGIQIGNSSYWVGKYTIQPENGGVGVFTHEFGHDLGLPDLYDTSGGENGTGFWTLMSSGSWMGDGTVDIGSKSSHMGAWEKFQLGWLKYDVAYAGKSSAHKLGPMETNTKQAQGLFVVLPDKYYTVSSMPPEGTHFYYSGSGNLMDNFMYREFTLGTGSALTAKVQYNIEKDWDYAYLVVSTDGGTTWTSIQTNQSTSSDPNHQNFGFGITGNTGVNWVNLSADLSAYDGQTVLLGFRYWTDPYVAEKGFKVDELVVSGYPLDGAESDPGWTYEPGEGGFRIELGGEEEYGPFFNAYVAEFRQYRGYDQSLRNAYNFGFLDNPALQDWVERFPYQDGLLINYWDTSFANNNVGSACAAGRCGGLLLTVDAHPTPLIRADGNIWRGRMQAYDATFSLEPTEAITLNYRSQPSYHPSLPAVPIFDDRLSYYDPTNPLGSVIVPVTGTQIRIMNYSALGNFMQVEVRPAK